MPEIGIRRWISGFIGALTVTTINALTLAAASVGFTLSGGTTSKTLTVLGHCTVGGAAINPTLPAFLVKPTSDQNNIAVSSLVTVVWGTKVFDQASNFASNIFTAPVTGKYHLSALIQLANLDSASGYYVLQLVTTNRTYQSLYPSSVFLSDQAYAMFPFSILADMNLGDTAYIEFYQETGTQQTTIRALSWFSGFLVC